MRRIQRGGKGLCEYGVLPSRTPPRDPCSPCDLMKAQFLHCPQREKSCTSGRKRAPGEEIKTVYSHEQAVNQCKGFLRAMNWEPELCSNTAVAAKKVAEGDSRSAAAICSPECAALYGLSVLKSEIQDSRNNHTRFLCIGREPAVFEGSDKISIEVNLSHTPGSLNHVLNRFATLGLNLTKLES
ncbi:MAG: prephenate dehydratase, partial [Christensenellaceae bacterium]